MKWPTTFREHFSNSEGWKNLDTKNGIRHKKNMKYNLLLFPNSVTTEQLLKYFKSKVEASTFPCQAVNLLCPHVWMKNSKHTVLEGRVCINNWEFTNVFFLMKNLWRHFYIMVQETTNDWYSEKGHKQIYVLCT